MLCYIGRLATRKDPQTGSTGIGSILSNLLALIFGDQPKSPATDQPPTAIADLRRFSIEEIKQITENLKTKLGEGGSGPVYYGKLENGQQVAVKILKEGSGQGANEFLNELAILSRVNHKNLVALFGYCNQSSERILVYEYMPKGTVREHLQGIGAVNEPLDWLARLRIAVDAANGLKYLHTECTQNVVHRDIKSTNILLDEKLNGKVADFGLSKLMSTNIAPPDFIISTNVKGTFGYLDPEYAMMQRLTDKSDVYSFGIVLLELISERSAVIEICDPEPGAVNIKDWAAPHILAGNLEFIVDRTIRDHIHNLEALKKMACIALRSVDFESAKRPTSTEVANELEGALRMELSATELIDTQLYRNHVIEIDSSNYSSS